MGTLSEKYIAGFLDADGSIKVKWNPLAQKDAQPGFARPYLALSFSQRSVADEPLRMMHAQFGGSLAPDPRGPYTVYELAGKEGVMLLQRIRKFLVIKRHYADCALDLVKEPRDKSLAVAYMKVQRKVRSTPLPVYPSRKWLAGYFDGDGCFNCLKSKGEHTVSIVAAIAAAGWDDEGLCVIQQFFGGDLKPIAGREHLKMLTIRMQPSKALEMLDYFGKHLIIKRDQAEFVRGCAQMGSYRDGDRISAVMKQLKAQPHRLSELGAVSGLIASVRKISDEEVKHRRCGAAYQQGMAEYFARRRELRMR